MIFWFFNFSLVKLYLISSILGVATTYLVFLSGKIIGGRKLAQVASLVYAGSFLISLYDRRLYHLTLNSFLGALSVFALLAVLKGKLRYIILLSLPVAFSFHSDASLVVLAIAIVLCFLIFKLPFKRKKALRKPLRDKLQQRFGDINNY